MTSHFAKLLNLIWMVSMGLFLGLTAGTILAVVETFDSSRKINATPGDPPYSDPRFAETANEVVAGFIAQNLFLVGGSVALVLLGIALLTRLVSPLLNRAAASETLGSRPLGWLQLAAVLLCGALMLVGASNMMQMREAWPSLYETGIDQAVLDERRAEFDRSHKLSERVVGGAWFIGAFALVITPWCRRIADTPNRESEEAQQQ